MRLLCRISTITKAFAESAVHPRLPELHRQGRFPVDRLKLDMSFIAGLGTGDDSAKHGDGALVAAAINLAHALGVEESLAGGDAGGEAAGVDVEALLFFEEWCVDVV